MNLRTFIGIIYIILSMLGLHKAGVEKNLIMEPICALGLVISILATVISSLIHKLKQE